MHTMLARPHHRSSRLRTGLLLVVAFSAYPAANGAATPRIDHPILLTQVPHRPTAPSKPADPPGLISHDWFSGARLVKVSPDGQLRILSESFHSACDPNVSFDGQRLLFAGKKRADSAWQVYEMDADGQGARPVSPDGLEARSPIYVSTLFTLDSPEPWFTTVFVGRQLPGRTPGPAAWTSLFNVKLDGSELRQLTHNPGPALDPFQMWDGRVIYASTRQPLEPGPSTARLGLFAIHIEGADVEFYGAGAGQRIQHMPCATAGGWVLFVETADATWDGAGQLAGVRESRPHTTYQRLTEDPAWLYLYPSPGTSNSVLVSRRPAQGPGTCGVVTFEVDTRRVNPLFDSPDYDDVQAVLLAPRPRPDGHSTVVETKATNGTFYCLNVYDADERIRPHLTTGTVKRVRFIETVTPVHASSTANADAPTPALLRRLIGEAPVETDGSFNVEVPASTPLLLQTLDERGMALATCGFVWVQPKETRGCIGCHEDPELIPENHYVQALRRPSNRLILPPDQRRIVTFQQDIAPILRTHCATADCHGSAESSLPLPLADLTPAPVNLARAYQTLLTPASPDSATPAPPFVVGKYVDPGRARTSWLAWQLVGQNTSRPYDPTPVASNRKVQPMPPPGKGTPLRPEQRITLIQWIDLGAPFDASSLTGLRNPLAPTP